MKRIITILLAAILAFPAAATAENADSLKQQRIIYALSTVYKGDTIPTFELYEVTIYAPRTFSTKRKQKQYDKLTRNVIKMYPISQEIKAILVETYLYMQTLPDDEARQKHIEDVEEGVWEQYYPVMRRCTLAQGKLLIKLIDRECNQTSYELINAFAGRFKATFYQAFAALFGASLKKEYDPTDGEDEMIEEIIYLIENDMI
ncbi:MAG: DUF4294 domain-containing protein [Bacteroidaceae bacterium]|nr:DUF4294 domain-containing protein [Bacteroidaceae bacterium]